MIEEIIRITGEINIQDTIHGSLSSYEEFTSDITLPDVVDGRHYEGEYEVIPSFDNQVLETRGLLMDDDVTVDAIQVSRTTNPSGGTTVYIGGIING